MFIHKPYTKFNYVYSYHYYNCTGTVMILLQSFASQFDTEYNCSSYHFWSPLCKLLIEQKHLQCYLTSLQTQALLHGVHLHLTVLETNFPLCSNQPVSQTINQYSFTVQEDVTRFMKHGGKFTLLVHSSYSSVNIYNWRYSDSDTEVHVIDTFDGSMTRGKLIVTFFAPISFLQENYYVSLVFRDSSVLDHGVIRRPEIYNKYLFNQMKSSHYFPMPSSLGTIFQHSGNDSCFETAITLHDEALSALQDHQLTPEEHSDSAVRIRVSDAFNDVCYPYSIDYNKLAIRLSQKNRKITITANRKCHCIYDEEPVFMVNPENTLSLPIMPISQTDATYFCELQSNRPHISEDPAIINLKHDFVNMN